MNQIDTTAIKEQYDLRTLAEQYTMLKRESTRELSGPCPKCGGADRFHVTSDWFFCRQCHEKHGDVIEFIRFLEGCTFQEACSRLGENRLAIPTRKQQPQKKQRRDRDYRHLAVSAVHLLVDDVGQPGRAYLSGRGIAETTWRAWGVGLLQCKRYGPDRELVDIGWGVAMPWLDNQRVTGINCRLLEPVEFQGKTLRYHRRGDVTKLFGEHMAKQRQIGLFIEGEINALSIWQILGDEVDVWSLGSESAVRSDRFIEIACRYEQVIFWCDRESVVRLAMLRCPGAVGIKSPRGLDANDLLKMGLLAEFMQAFMKPTPKQVVAKSQPRPNTTVIGFSERRYAELIAKTYLLPDESAELRQLAAQLGRTVELTKVPLSTLMGV